MPVGRRAARAICHAIARPTSAITESPYSFSGPPSISFAPARRPAASSAAWKPSIFALRLIVMPATVAKARRRWPLSIRCCVARRAASKLSGITWATRERLPGVAPRS